MATKMNNDSDKGCKCKQSMCVKLYCACFKAENYCGDDCCCKECFNRVDYEDTVEMARDKAKLREPLAFEPKIETVEQSPRSNNIEGGNQLMPTLIRKHRKGCTCKNSECLRLYCECYKGQVGCSSACRCVGCKNSYGKRGEYNVCNPPHIMRATNDQFTPHENRFLQSSTPVTMVQYSDRTNHTSTHGGYIPIPISPNITMIGTNRRELDIVPLNQQSYPNVEPINQFTPQEINQMMMEWNPNETINVYDNTRLNIIQSEPYIPSSSGSVPSPDNKQQ